MIVTDAGIALREALEDVPTRCFCCEPRQQLATFRNGPHTQLAVCPRTRAALILRDSMPAISSGFYTGSLNGV
jgi:hypothetical protein